MCFGVKPAKRSVGLELESVCVVSSRFDTLSSDCSITMKTVKNESWLAYTLASRVDKRNMSVHPYRIYDTQTKQLVTRNAQLA